MIRKEFIVVLGLLCVFTFGNVGAQSIELKDDFPVGKITIKFRSEMLIRKVDVERDPTEPDQKRDTLMEPPIDADKLNPKDEPPKSLFVSDLLEFPQDFPPPPDAKISLEQLRDDLTSLNKIMFDLDVDPIKTFSEQTPEELTKLRENAERTLKKNIADLNLFYDFYYANKTEFLDVKTFVESLDTLEIVEQAQVISPPVESPAPDFQSNQTYLNRPVSGGIFGDGVGALSAWGIPGGAGAGVKIMDIEYNWNPSHEDFPTIFFNSGSFFSGGGLPAFNTNHGTAVVGILAARRNGMGVTGIANESQVGLMSTHTTGAYNVGQSIVSSISLLSPGDIILIEQQTRLPSAAQNHTCGATRSPLGPSEWDSGVFAATQVAMGNGIIVVAAGGNGGINLDHPSLGNRFNRSTRDSGAIIVAAAESPTNDHRPTCYSPHGSRIDSHARAANVASLGYGNLFNGGFNSLYTAFFGGTSSASPIVASSAASIQGMLKAQGQAVLSPLAMRELLTTTGSPQVANFDRDIATLPDIIEAARSLGLINMNMVPIYFILLLDDI